MSKSGMRWGDSCSSDEEEYKVKLTRHESSSGSEDLSDDYSADVGMKDADPPAKFVSTGGGGGNNRRGQGGRGSNDDRWDNRGGRSGRLGRGGIERKASGGGRQGRQPGRGERDWPNKNNKGGGRKGGKQGKISVSVGASEWKVMAKEAKKYGKDKFDKPNHSEKSSPNEPVQGNKWMAIRQKKAEEKRTQDMKKREEELKERRKAQAETLRAAVEQKQKGDNFSEKDKQNDQSQARTAPLSSLAAIAVMKKEQAGLSELEKKFSSQTVSPSNAPNSRPKLLLKPRTLPLPEKSELTAGTNDAKMEKSKTKTDEKDNNQESGEDESVITSSSAKSGRSGAGRGNRNNDQRRSGRGRGKGPDNSSSNSRRQKGNDPKKDKIPHKHHMAVKGDLLPNGTVRLSKHSRGPVNNDGKKDIRVKGHDHKNNNKNTRGDDNKDRGMTNERKNTKSGFRLTTKIEIGAKSETAENATK